MAKEVHMIYTGIIGLVPRTKGFVQPAEFTVVVQQPKEEQHHVAFLLVEEECVVKATEELIKSQRVKSGMVVYPLSQYAIEVTNTITSAEWRENSSLREFTLPLESHSPNESKFSDIQRGVLTGRVPETLAARIQLVKGSISSSWVHPHATWKWERSTVPGLHPPEKERHLAQEVCHTFKIAEDLLQLTLRRNNDTSEHLTIRAFDDTSQIEVLIGNVHEGDVFGSNKQPGTEDTHVRMYFDLASLSPPTRRMLERGAMDVLKHLPQDTHKHRLTADSPNSLGPRRVGGANCPPGLWTQV